MFEFRNSQTIGDKLGIPRTIEEMNLAIKTNYIIPAFRDGIITVDKMLDHADVVLDWYIPSEYAIDFINFIRLVLGEEPENSNPKSHYFLIDCIFQQKNVEPYFIVRNINYEENKNRIVVLCTREYSKALTLDTEIATPNGYVEMRDIKDDDIVFDGNGKETRVVKKSKLFMENTYRITLADGRILETSWNHDNIVWKRYCKRIKGYSRYDLRIYGLKEEVLTTEELFSNGDGWKIDRTRTKNHKKGWDYKYYIPRMTAPIEFPEADFDLDPYTVGLKLEAEESIDTDISHDKRIPAPLMTGSVKQRIAVLQGLMDANGSINKKGTTKFTSTSKGLAEDVLQLIRTLGGTGTITEKTASSNSKIIYVVNININNISLFRLDHKKSRERYVPVRDMVGIENIELIHSVPTQCIAVESDTKSFILKNGVVTHNSTLIGTMLPLYMAYNGKLPEVGSCDYGLYIGDSMRNNVKTTMETIGSVFNESIFLRNAFEDSTTNQDEVSFVRKPRTTQELALYNEYVVKQGLKKSEVPGRMKLTFTMKGIGASTGGRGSRDALKRPKFSFFDDMLGNEQDATSEVILENIESTIEADILPSMHGQGNFAIVIGTPYNKNDPVYKRIENGLWLPIVFPKAEKISIDLKKEDFRGVWPDRHTYEACMRDFKRAHKAQENGNPVPMRKLMQEYYLRISSDEDRLIQENYIQWFNRSDIIANSWNYNWYITTDYTSTANDGSDLSGNFLWAVDSNQNHFLVDMTLRKLELEAQYNETFSMAMQMAGSVRWSEVGVEIDGQQNLHIIALEDRMPKKNFFLSFAKQKGAKAGAKGIRSKLEGGNKHWRFRMTLPLWQNHKIWFAKELNGTQDMNELLEEIRYVNYSSFGSAHDDGCDCISQLIMMDIQYPAPGENYKPVKKIGMNKTGINAKIWAKKNEEDDADSTAYDSYA